MTLQNKENGFTLIELMIAMAISTVVLGGIYGVYGAQVKQHKAQRQIAGMQQNIRAVMFLLERDIRLAGYSTADPAADAGFVAAFATPHDSCGATTDGDHIAFTVDNDNSGGIEDTTSFEMIAYRHDSSNNTVERYDAVSASWQIAAQQIESLDFVYLDESSTATAVAAEIRSVRITITAKAGSTNERRMSITHRVVCRNLG